MKASSRLHQFHDLLKANEISVSPSQIIRSFKYTTEIKPTSLSDFKEIMRNNLVYHNDDEHFDRCFAIWMGLGNSKCNDQLIHDEVQKILSNPKNIQPVTYNDEKELLKEQTRQKNEDEYIENIQKELNQMFDQEQTEMQNEKKELEEKINSTEVEPIHDLNQDKDPNKKEQKHGGTGYHKEIEQGNQKQDMANKNQKGEKGKGQKGMDDPSMQSDSGLQGSQGQRQNHKNSEGMFGENGNRSNQSGMGNQKSYKLTESGIASFKKLTQQIKSTNKFAKDFAFVTKKEITIPYSIESMLDSIKEMNFDSPIIANQLTKLQSSPFKYTSYKTMINEKALQQYIEKMFASQKQNTEHHSNTINLTKTLNQSLHTFGLPTKIVKHSKKDVKKPSQCKIFLDVSGSMAKYIEPIHAISNLSSKISQCQIYGYGANMHSIKDVMKEDYDDYYTDFEIAYRDICTYKLIKPNDKVLIISDFSHYGEEEERTIEALLFKNCGGKDAKEIFQITVLNEYNKDDPFGAKIFQDINHVKNNRIINSTHQFVDAMKHFSEKI